MDRTTRGRLGAHTKWAGTPDRAAATAAARAALAASFEARVPAEVTDPEARRKAGENAKKAHYLRMAARSAEVRADKMRARAEALMRP